MGFAGIVVDPDSRTLPMSSGGSDLCGNDGF